MLRNIVIASAVLIMTGCASTPSQLPEPRQLPARPSDYVCGELLAPENGTYAEVLRVSVHNHGLYVECQQAVNDWRDWYNKVKKSFSVNK